VLKPGYRGCYVALMLCVKTPDVRKFSPGLQEVNVIERSIRCAVRMQISMVRIELGGALEHMMVEARGVVPQSGRSFISSISSKRTAVAGNSLRPFSRCRLSMAWMMLLEARPHGVLKRRTEGCQEMC